MAVHVDFLTEPRAASPFAGLHPHGAGAGYQYRASPSVEPGPGASPSARAQ